MLNDWIKRPIPPPPPEGPRVIPQECGEPAVDATGLHPRVQFLASYRAQGIDASPRRLWLRRSVAQRLCRAADTLEEGMSLAVFDGLRPAPVQQALFDSYRARLAAEHPDWPPQRLWTETCRFVAAPQADPLYPSSHLTFTAMASPSLWGRILTISAPKPPPATMNGPAFPASSSAGETTAACSITLWRPRASPTMKRSGGTLITATPAGPG